jgi:paired amphipathic helix protein Sin3a
LFQLDIVIEVNKFAMQTLEFVNRRMNKMKPDELSKYRLDDNLGSRSPAIMQRAIRRIYGDKSTDIIVGLKKNPSVAVPLVIKRLRSKDEEWRDAQKGFNRIWREQNEKYHLKSLDHQGLTFKQNDLKQIRSKAIINQIETLYDEV